MIKLQRSEELALGQYLSNWPENVSFQKICQMLTLDQDFFNEDEIELFNEIIIWEPFENYDNEDVARMIEDSQGNLEFIDRTVSGLKDLLEDQNEFGSRITEIIEDLGGEV